MVIMAQNLGAIFKLKTDAATQSRLLYTNMLYGDNKLAEKHDNPCPPNW